MKRLISALSLVCVLSVVSVGGPSDDGLSGGWTGLELALNEADARGRGGHRGGGHRGPSRSANASMRRPSASHRPASRPRGNTNVDRNVDRNVNRNIDVDRNVDVDVHRRRYGYGGAVVAGAVVAGAFISTLPTGCNTVVINGIRYYDCGNTYYVESYQGTDVVYEAVDAPN